MENYLPDLLTDCHRLWKLDIFDSNFACKCEVYPSLCRSFENLVLNSRRRTLALARDYAWDIWYKNLQS